MITAIMKVLLTVCLMLLVMSHTLAHVMLDSPTGGESYDPDQTVNISWHILVVHPQENWDLYFSTDGGSTWQDLALDIPSDQLSYSWTVPDVETSQARIKIVMDNVSVDYQAESDDFSIGIFVPLILNYPMGDENFLGGTTEQISWQVNLSVSFDSWSLFFSDDGGASWSAIAENLLPATLKYDWLVPQLNTSQGQIRLEMNIAGSIYDDLSGDFTISEEVVTALIEVQGQTGNLSVYPNPFTTKTDFKIVISQSTAVKLDIYNQTGALVYTKDYTRLGSGMHNLEWRPTGIPAGLYFYRLQTNSRSSSGKLLYTKQP